MLFDMFGRPIPGSVKAPDERQVTSVEIRDRYNEYPSRRLTPQKLTAIFTEADQGSVWRQSELFEEMLEKDLHLFSVMSTRISAVSKLAWEILPAGDDSRARETADFVREAINGLDDFEDNLKDILDGVGKGFSALEILWELKGGSHLPVKLERAEQKKFNWITAIYPKVRTPENQWPGADLDPWKWVFHVHNTASGWAPRQGLLRRCAWWYIFRNYAVKDWVAFAEIFGQPLRVGKYDMSASREDKDALLRAVRELGSDAAAIISKATEIEFVEAQARTAGKSIYESLMDYGAAEMSKGVLGHSSAADSTPGKLGGEDQAVSVRQDIVEDDAEQVMKTLRRDLVRPIVIFKYGPDAPLPWFKLKYEPAEDEQAGANLWGSHIKNGFPISIESYAEKFNLPIPKAGAVLLKPSAAAPPDPSANGEETALANRETPPAPPLGKGRIKAGCGCGTFAGKEDVPAPDAVDLLAGNLLARTAAPTGNPGADGTSNFRPSLLSAQTDPVKKLMNECATLEEFRDRLFEAYAGMDTVQLADLMADGFALAELYGRYTAIADKSVRATWKGDA